MAFLQAAGADQPDGPITFPGQNAFTSRVIVAAFVSLGARVYNPDAPGPLYDGRARPSSLRLDGAGRWLRRHPVVISLSIL